MFIQCSLTLLFEPPFWIGLYERTTEGHYEICKITFGAEPKDYAVYEFLLLHWDSLKFSPPVRAEGVEKRRINPKRMQREISGLLKEKGASTKAQQALKLQQEQGKKEKKIRSREQKEADKERKFALRQEKKKEKHKGR